LGHRHTLPLTGQSDWDLNTFHTTTHKDAREDEAHPQLPPQATLM
jgi:hypothetical protein